MTKSFALVDLNGICINTVAAESAETVLKPYPLGYSAFEITDNSHDKIVGQPYPLPEGNIDNA